MLAGLPEYGWRVARLCFVFLALVAATALAQLYPPAESVFQNSLTLF
jgi:predicted MFS family arabinose efflux permease